MESENKAVNLDLKGCEFANCDTAIRITREGRARVSESSFEGCGEAIVIKDSELKSFFECLQKMDTETIWEIFQLLQQISQEKDRANVEKIISSSKFYNFIDKIQAIEWLCEKFQNVFN